MNRKVWYGSLTLSTGVLGFLFPPLWILTLWTAYKTLRPELE